MTDIGTNIHGEAAGSIWNKGSWQWEEKNLSKQAIQLLTEEVGKMNLQTDTKCEMNVDIDKMDAAISVRKGKKIVTWEFSAKITAKDENKTYKIDLNEVAREDMEDEDDWQPKLKPDIKMKKAFKDINTHIKNVLTSFDDRFSNIIGSADQLAADKERREQELSLAAKAREENQATKDAIYAAQKEKEIATKVANRGFETIAPDAAKGSAWNVNSHHWEEKPKTKWVNEKLAEVFPEGKELDTDFMGKITLKDVSLKGEASITVRKAKIMKIYDYKISFAVNKGSEAIANMTTQNVTNYDDEIEWDTFGKSVSNDEKKLQSFFEARFQKFRDEFEALKE